LSAASRALGLTQPTLSRQVSALEQSLGIILFERGHRTITLTQAGLELLEHVRDMGDAANRISLAASGQVQSIDGCVTITATETMATYTLPAILKQLREQAPNLRVRINAASELQDLTHREADIAIRHVRPEQPELFARLVATTTGHFYASREFLDSNGHPEQLSDLVDADFVGVGHRDFVGYLNALGLAITEDNLRVDVESGPAVIAMVRAGLGVGVLTRDSGHIFPDLIDLFPNMARLDIPVWLVTHRELHTSARIRLVFDLLAKMLAET